MVNDAYALLAAERRARALVIQCPPASEQTWCIDAHPDADGAALLAAARLASRFGAGVAVRLPRSDLLRHAPGYWHTLADSARRIGLIDLETADAAGGLRIVKADTEWLVAAPALPDAQVAWRMSLEQACLFVRPAGPDERLFTAAESQTVDRRAMEKFGVPGLCLMENAALDAAAVALDMLGSDRLGPVLVVAGGGNNGGDGLALARGLAGMGIAIEVALLKDPASLTGDAAANLDLLRDAAGATLHPLHDSSGDISAFLAGKTLAVDALLGTGFKGVPSPAYAKAIDCLNRSGVPVLALDLPSGLDADSGLTPGAVVHARRTVTFVGVKAGLVGGKGPECSGKVYIGDIGAPIQVL